MIRRLRSSWRSWAICMSMTPSAPRTGSMPSTFGAADKLIGSGKRADPGFLIEKELKFLGDALENPKRPFIAILGGAKVSDKIAVIENLLAKADTILIGGAMALYVLPPRRGRRSASRFAEKDKVELAKSLLEKANGKILSPVDTVISDKMTDDAADFAWWRGIFRTTWKGLTLGPRRRRSCMRTEDQGGEDGRLERSDGRVREEAVREWNEGGGRGAG